MAVLAVFTVLARYLAALARYLTSRLTTPSAAVLARCLAYKFAEALIYTTGCGTSNPPYTIYSATEYISN